MLDEWAKRWGVPAEAITELNVALGAASHALKAGEFGHSETVVQSRIRLACAKAGQHMWRNNRGACLDERGNFIRYGLANDSPRVDEVIKSGDLIGVRSVIITPQMVGARIGQFVSYEVKRPGWKYTGKGREEPQQKWNLLIASMGGYAKFITDERDI